MIESLTATHVKGILLDRHVAVSNAKQFRDESLEIGRTLNYEYYVGLSVRPPHNSTHICDMINKCADDIVKNEAFESAALKVCNLIILSNSYTLFDCLTYNARGIYHSTAEFSNF